MPKRTPAQSITVDRREDGADTPKFVIPPIGKPYEFTAAEIKSITKRNPDAFEAEKDADEEEDDGLTDEEREAAREIAEQAKAEAAERRQQAKDAKAAADKIKADKAKGAGSKGDDDI